MFNRTNLLLAARNFPGTKRRRRPMVGISRVRGNFTAKNVKKGCRKVAHRWSNSVAISRDNSTC